MKILNVIRTGLIISIVPSMAYANLNYPCSGVAGSYHTNPDSSVGGFVASTASVDNTVIIHSEASVCDKAVVIEGVTLEDRSVVEGKATVRGKVIVSGNAKVYGEAYVINTNGTDLVVADDARIYGHAFLQGSVVVSGTSEVFGWGKVLDFAQLLGNSKICGKNFIKNQTVLQDDQSQCVQK